MSSPPNQRMLSPDLARGITLFGIAGANLATAWAPVVNAPLGSTLGGVVDDSIADKVAVVFGALFLHVRGLPMFATLLGFGVGLISMSLYRRQYPLPAAKKAIARRYGFLALFGVIHCIFLFYGDIMLSYGLMGMLLALCLTLKDKTLLITAGVLFAINTVMFIGLALLMLVIGDATLGQNMLSPQASFGNELSWLSDTYWGQLLVGFIVAVTSPLTLPTLILMLGPLMIVGFVAARRGILANVDQHKRLLWIATGITIAVMLLIGLPLGLSGIGVIPARYEMTFMMLNQAFGVLTGPGIVAMIALASQPLQRRLNDGHKLPAPIVALQALGKRSMSGYVGQSILCLIFVVPYTFGFGQEKGAADTLGIAALIWLATLIGAYALELAGKRGPFEYLHRRLSYGKTLELKG